MSDIFFSFDGMAVNMEPAITKWLYEDLGDNPETHRWRAWWALSDVDGLTGGIELRAYPVIKVNPQSVWIDEYAYREGRSWVHFGQPIKKRLCHNGAGSAWAKPTQDEAIRSLAIRLCRWTGHLSRELKRAESAIKAMEALRPDLPAYTDKARQNLAKEKP